MRGQTAIFNSAHPNQFNYRFIDTQSTPGAQGGIWPCPPDGKPLVMLYITVDDVAAYVEKAHQLGGNVIISPQSSPMTMKWQLFTIRKGWPLGCSNPPVLIIDMPNCVCQPARVSKGWQTL
ncbi:MAG TPA: hypothetical protein VEF04_13325 [Blastocatellia bacterium]|nr:hypothetical protein [Blastocatellia bacterium]